MSVRKHRRAMTAKGCGNDWGTMGSEDARPSHCGGRCVRASTSVAPSDQRSAAGEMFPSATSGGSYTVRVAEGLIGAPAKERPSVESFKRSPAATMFEGLSLL